MERYDPKHEQNLVRIKEVMQRLLANLEPEPDDAPPGPGAEGPGDPPRKNEEGTGDQK